ncbi:hypothetical protein SSTU70S_01859 [Stutzerimonas stutzeri]
MSIQNSPYAAFATLLAGSAQAVSPAELHGLLLGRSCAGADFLVEPWLADAADLLGEMPEGNVRQALIGLQEMVKGELAGEDIAVVLLLPNDDAPLTERAVALGQWCQGFLAGFGLIAGDRALSAEAMEVLQDLSAIAQYPGCPGRLRRRRERLHGGHGVPARRACIAVHRMRQAARAGGQAAPALRKSPAP